MLCLVSLSVLAITLSGIYSEHVVKARSLEYSEEEIVRCEQECRRVKRHCVLPPSRCGECVDKYSEYDGICLPKKQVRSNDLDPGCRELECDLDCEYGLMRNEHNCEVCRCMPNPPPDVNPACPIPMCANYCEHYANNEHGCMTCDCLNEREITDEDIDSLIDEYRKLRLQKEDEIAKDVKEPRDVDENATSPQQQQQVAQQPVDSGHSHTLNDEVFVAVVAGCSVAGLVGLVVAGVCWYRLQKNVKAASEVEYPAYGITGPTKETVGSPGDRKLAQSAQMYHYQHQKQQMIALEKANGEMNHAGSEDDSDEENEEGDYTVYECPGLAPTGEMEVKNPLFSEETPVTPTPDDRRDLK